MATIRAQKWNTSLDLLSSVFRLTSRGNQDLFRRLNGIGLLLFLGLVGCNSSNQPDSALNVASSPNSIVENSRESSRRIQAQGQLLPASGIIKIFATPGDVVAEMPVAVGSQVKTGDVLAVMRSQAAIDARRAGLTEQKHIANREKQASVLQAELKVKAAELALQQSIAQQSSVHEQARLLEVGEEQLATAENTLDSLKKIANDELTREFVGKIELDQQRIAVDESRLQLAEKKATFQRSKLQAGTAVQIARQELEAATTMLKLAQESEAAHLIDLQIAALDSEGMQSTLRAPSDAVVLSIGAPIGGSAVQTPLFELASLENIVCESEVHVSDADRIKVGQKAFIRSRVLGEREMSGIVTEKSRLVGRPRLRSLDPLAAADYRTVVVMVQVDDPEWASQWLQLQVEVVFEP